MNSAAVLASLRPASTPLHFHVHLPRTAGSALQRTWRDRGGWFLQLPLDESSGTPDQLGERLRTALADRRPVLIGGHHPYRLIRPALQDGDLIYVAIREPVERAASLYRYAQSMCQDRTIVNYPGDIGVRTRWNADWRDNVAARGLDPDDFTLAQFVGAGLCSDDDFRAFFAAGDTTAPEDLGQEMSRNGFAVLQGRTAQRLLGRQPVNRTVSGSPTIAGADRELLEAHLRKDLISFASITDAFPARGGRFRLTSTRSAKGTRT